MASWIVEVAWLMVDERVDWLGLELLLSGMRCLLDIYTSSW